MRFKKGSKEAKAFMAKLRAAKGGAKKDVSKKIGAVKTNKIDKIMSKLNKKSITALADFCLQNNIPFSYGWPKKTFLQTIEDTLLSRNDNQIKKINFNRSLIFKKTTKKVGSTLKLTPKENRLGATDKDFKKQSKSYHKDTKSHNVNIRVVSGINGVTEKINKSLEWIEFYKEQLNWWKNFKPKEIYEKKGKTDSIKFYTKSLANEKRHLNSIKQTI
jgi:hypothetical protein